MNEGAGYKKTVREFSDCLIGLTVVWNEADIIEASLRTSCEVCDLVVVVANPSSDGTDEIIRALVGEGLPIIPWWRSQNCWDQDRITSVIYTHVQAILDNPAILVFDADEILVVDDQEAFREELSKLPENTVGRLRWKTMLPPAEGIRGAATDLSDFSDCLAKEIFAPGKVVKPQSTNVHAKWPVPRGGHNLLGPDARPMRKQDLTTAYIAHVPVRSCDQVAAQCLLGWTAKAVASSRALSPSENRHWRSVVQRLLQGDLPDPRTISAQYAGLGYVTAFSDEHTYENVPGSLPSRSLKYGHLVRVESFDQMIVQRLALTLQPREGAVHKLIAETGSIDAFGHRHLECDWPPIEYICQTTNPKSVVEVGCGTYLGLIERTTGATVHGFDAVSWFSRHQTSDGHHHRLDLAGPHEQDISDADLVICIQVLEYMKESEALKLVRALANRDAGTLLFSVAQPGQHGTGEICLQEPEFWLEIFHDSGWRVDTFRTLGVRLLACSQRLRNNAFVLRKDIASDPTKNLEHLLLIGRQPLSYPANGANVIASYPGENEVFENPRSSLPSDNAVHQLEARVHDLQRTLNVLKDRDKRKDAAIQTMQARNRDLVQDMATIRSSKSWRITKPLRALNKLLFRARHGRQRL